MDCRDLHHSEYNGYREKLLLEGYQRYFDWWHPIDIAGDSFMGCMTLDRWMEYLLTFPDEEWFDRWLNEEEFIVGIDGSVRESRIRMKQFISKRLCGHFAKWIDLHDKENPFQLLEEKFGKTEK